MEAAFLDGARRVIRVVEGVDDYEPIIGRKVPDQLRAVLDDAFDADGKRRAAVEYIIATIQSSKSARWIFPEVDVLLFGKTKNNLREFKFLENINEDVRLALKCNAADLTLVKDPMVAATLRQYADMLRLSIVSFFGERESVSAPGVYQVSQYIVQFLRYVISLQHPNCAAPGLAVVANDHSTSPVAFSVAMKLFGVPRIYVQHAEISSHFPPLDFEISVLRNERSRQIYKQIGPSQGNVFVISRFREPFRFPQIASAGPYSVAIYPPGRVVGDGLQRVIGELRRNPDVSEIVIKAHPNQGPVSWPDGVAVHQSELTSPHLALVGNSSVVIELLHRGIPVFQNFDFDPVEPDYYGFVRTKISSAVDIEDLSKPFWKAASYDAQWYDRYSHSFSPREETSLKEEQRLAAAIAKIRAKRFQKKKKILTRRISIFNPRLRFNLFAAKIVDLVCAAMPETTLRIVNHVAHRSPLRDEIAMRELRRAGLSAQKVRQPKIGWVQFSIENAKDPANWLIESISNGIVTQEEALRACEFCYVARHPASFALFDAVDQFEPGSPMHLWTALKRFEVAGVELPSSLRNPIDCVLAVKSSRYVRTILEGLAFSTCLRLNDMRSLDRLLEQGRYVRLSDLSTTRRIALLRHAARGNDIARYRKLRQEFWDAETPLHRLKIADLDAVLGFAPEASNHGEMETAFENAVNPSILEEFKNFIKPTYDNVRPKMRFMDVRSSPHERAAFQQRVIEALTKREPFSMIRLGDGEGYALAEGNRFFTEEDVRNRERHWWGETLDPALRQVITDHVRGAIEEADVLGLPSIYRFVRDTLDKSISYQSSIQGRGLLQVLSYFQSREVHMEFGEDRMNLALFRSPDMVVKMVKAAKKCILVSSADPSATPDWLAKRAGFRQITIPTHLRTSRNGRYAQFTRPLPYVFQEVNEQVRSATRPGTLVLVAAGIIGKIFIATAKSSGGVGLDIGSVMDEWLEAGIHSLH